MNINNLSNNITFSNIEKEFTSKYNNAFFNGNIYDISIHSYDLGISLYGSLIKINEKLNKYIVYENQLIENIISIEKYLDFISINIKNIDFCLLNKTLTQNKININDYDQINLFSYVYIILDLCLKSKCNLLNLIYNKSKLLLLNSINHFITNNMYEFMLESCINAFNEFSNQNMSFDNISFYEDIFNDLFKLLEINNLNQSINYFDFNKNINKFKKIYFINLLINHTSSTKQHTHVNNFKKYLNKYMNNEFKQYKFLK